MDEDLIIWQLQCIATYSPPHIHTSKQHLITSVHMVPGTAVMVAYESCMTIYHQLQLKKSYGLICIMGFGNGTHND